MLVGGEVGIVASPPDAAARSGAPDAGTVAPVPGVAEVGMATASVGEASGCPGCPQPRPMANNTADRTMNKRTVGTGFITSATRYRLGLKIATGYGNRVGAVGAKIVRGLASP